MKTFKCDEASVYQVIVSYLHQIDAEKQYKTCIKTDGEKQYKTPNNSVNKS